MAEPARNGEEVDMAELLRLAGPRPQLPAVPTAEARARVHAAWRSGLRRRRARRGGLLVAAAALAGLAWGLAQRRPAPPPASVAAGGAVLDTSAAAVEWEAAEGWRALAVGGEAPWGPPLRTGAGGAGFRLDGGRSLRFAAASRWRFAAARLLLLEAGAVYVDSGGGTAGAGQAGFEVRTPRGAVQESGTQFEVRLGDRGLRVRVREGRVAVRERGRALDVTAGTELRLDGQGATRQAFPPHGPEWAWVLRLAPGFEMEGRTLHELLAWASRESGWSLRYLDRRSEGRARSARLHGSIRGVRPDEALGVVPSADLAHRLREGVLEVGPAD